MEPTAPLSHASAHSYQGNLKIEVGGGWEEGMEHSPHFRHAARSRQRLEDAVYARSQAGCPRTAVSCTKSTQVALRSLYNYIYLHFRLLGITHMLHYCPENISVHVKKGGLFFKFSMEASNKLFSELRKPCFQVKF